MLESGRVPLYLAPQAGVSESPFRRLCRGFGADVVVSEFVSSEGIRRHDRRTHEYLRFHDDERPIGIQIFGADPEGMAEAAALVEEVYAPDFLDIGHRLGLPGLDRFIAARVMRMGDAFADVVERHRNIDIAAIGRRVLADSRYEAIWHGGGYLMTGAAP